MKIYCCKCHKRPYTVCPRCFCQYCPVTWQTCPRCVESQRAAEHWRTAKETRA